MTDAQRREMKRRRVVWDLLRQYFNHLKARLTPGSQELVEKVEQQASSETTKDNDAP